MTARFSAEALPVINKQLSPPAHCHWPQHLHAQLSSGETRAALGLQSAGHHKALITGNTAVFLDS